MLTERQTDGRQTDGRRTQSDGKSSLCKWVYNVSDTTGAGHGTGVIYPSRAPELTPSF
jgi:hypothetical protein